MKITKKNQQAEEVLDTLAPASSAVSFSDLVHCTTSNLRDLGFRQIVLPPLLEKEIFVKNPILSQVYKDRFIEIENIGPGGSVFPPTHLLNVYQLYLAQLIDREENDLVAKWFHLSPVVVPGEKENQIQYELGIYILGSNSPLAYSQLINSSLQLAQSIGLSDIGMTLSSVGCGECQAEYRKLLYDHLRAEEGRLCDECADTVKREADDFSVFSCNKNSCRETLAGAPQLIDFLDDDCRQELIGVLETMDDLQIPYTLNSTHAFNPLAERVGFKLEYIGEDSEKDFLGEGGSYSHFSKHFGREENIPVLGFTTTLDRLAKYIEPEDLSQRSKAEVFVIPIGDLAARKALNLYEELRQADIQVREAMLMTSGIKRQLQIAQKHRPVLALIIGQKEAMDEMVILRDMQSSMQEVFTHDRIVEEVKKRLGR